jgi:putative transposase
MLKTHKIALDPNNKQRTLLAKSAGTARFAYNWALSKWNEQYEAWKADPSLDKPTQANLRKELNRVKRESFPWMLEVTKCAPQEAIINLGKAFENFFAGRAAYPTFKKRGVHDSFKVSAGFFKISENRIMLPKTGWIKTFEALRYEGAKLVSVTTSRTADQWFASVVCEVADGAENQGAEETAEKTVGIDVGVREYVTSDGDRYPVPRAYRNLERQIIHAQRSVSRKEKGSKNRNKAKLRLAKLHAKAANIRSDWLHKMTAEIVHENSAVVIEDLNVGGMKKNHRLAKSIADAAFGEFRRQLEYKAKEKGAKIIVADRFYPSSKICSVCGAKKERLLLSERVWNCEICGSRHDRDLNAAVNLKKYADSSAVSAC